MDYSKYHDRKFELRPNGVLIITMDRLSHKNAMSKKVHGSMGSMWRDVSRDPDVRVAIVTGVGDAFCAGGDLNIAEVANGNGAADMDEIIDHGRDLVLEMIECSKPIISAINGVAVGGGLALALGADIALMAEEATIFDGHIKLGIAAGDHAVLLWPLLMSLAKVRYYLLTCESISGREAEALGLVSKALPREKLMAEALRIAEKLATGPQPAIKMTKRALNYWVKSAAPAFDLSLAYESLNILSADFAEGVRSVRTKTPANFPSAPKT